MSASLSDLYASLRAQAHNPPADNARALSIAGRRCGWATPAACQALRCLTSTQSDPTLLCLGEHDSPGPELNALLARAAELLRDANCLRGWRNELLDICVDGETLGAIERAAFRPLGLPSVAVHLNAWTPDGKLWVARRALSKSTNPGMWDTLVGGLVGHGETAETALLRECDEEAGLEAPVLQQRTPLRTLFRMHRRLPEGYQVEDVLTSTCVLAQDVHPVNRDGEVMEIRTVPLDTAIRHIIEGQFTLEAALVIAEDILYRQAAGELAI